MTKWAALEGTTLIAREKPDLTRRILGKSGYHRVFDWLHKPGVSITKEGKILESLVLTSGHDPTEGGIATGIREIAVRSKIGVSISREKIYIKDETKMLCSSLGIDPLGLLSSGVFIFTVSADTVDRAAELLKEAGIPVFCIGTVTDREGDILIHTDGIPASLPVFQRDEIVKVSGQPDR